MEDRWREFAEATLSVADECLYMQRVAEQLGQHYAKGYYGCVAARLRNLARALYEVDGTDQQALPFDPDWDTQQLPF